MREIYKLLQNLALTSLALNLTRGLSLGLHTKLLNHDQALDRWSHGQTQ